MTEQGSGNIAYSFNKKRYYEILDKNKSLFFTNYIFTVFISFFFLTGSFILGRYITKETDEDGVEKTVIDRKLYNYFSEFCLGSPYKIMDIHRDGIKEILTPQEIKDGEEATIFIGFKQKSKLCRFIYTINS